MSTYGKNNKFVSYLIVLIALFIVILVTKNQITTLQENNDLKETYNMSLSDKKSKLNDLNQLKNKLSSTSQNTDKYNIDINEDEIIDYLYSHIEDTNGSNWIIIVKSISITEPTDTEIWFKETNINLNLRVSNEEKLVNMLDFLTSEDSKYNFFISSFTFPYWNIDKSFNVSIPLRVLHK